MNSSDNTFFISNIEDIMDSLEDVITEIDDQYNEDAGELFDNCNFSELINVLNKYRSDFVTNNHISVESLKMTYAIMNPEDKNKVYSDEEYNNLLKKIADVHGDRLYEIMGVSYYSFDMSNLDGLLNYDDPKYASTYRNVLGRKLIELPIDDSINILKNINKNAIDQDFIIKFIEQKNELKFGDKLIALASVLPKEMLEDGKIGKEMIKKIDSIYFGSEKLLDYIPETAYDSELVEMILNKTTDNGFYAIFQKIPKQLKTREIYERVCSNNSYFIHELPKESIDPNISEEEYNLWVNKLIVDAINTDPESSYSFFRDLDDSRKTKEICTMVAKNLSFSSEYEYGYFLEKVPNNCRSKELYEIILEKTTEIIRNIPQESFDPNISQEEYDKWYKSLVMNSIDKSNSMMNIRKQIPPSKMDEKLWNRMLDKCIETKEDKRCASLEYIDYENLTPQMIERAINEIDETQLYYIPCIDRKLDGLPEQEKEKYARWQSSLSEEEKKSYRDLYERLWIDFVNKNSPASLYERVPREGITHNMHMTCIDKDNFLAIKCMPLPETEQEKEEYQKLLIYAISKIEPINYNKEHSDLIEERDILENIPQELINEDVLRAAIEKSSIYLSYANVDSENFEELLNIGYKGKLESLGRDKLTKEEIELIQRFAHSNSDLFKTLKLEILDPRIVSTIGEDSLEIITRYKDVQNSVLKLANNEDALATFGFVLENLKEDSQFIEPTIEKLSRSISYQGETGYGNTGSQFLKSVNKRLKRKDVPVTDYEKVIISHLALNTREGKKINNYEDVLTYVDRKNSELENIVSNPNASLIDVKNAYLERVIGIDYETAKNLVRTYGNDPEELLRKYDNLDPNAYQELAEKEALEIIIKLKSIIETNDINALRSEFQKYVSEEKREDSYKRYKTVPKIDSTLRRAYGRDITESLSKTEGQLEEKELESGEKYYVRRVSGNFNRMVSLLGAYRKSGATEGDMYDRWNTSEMSGNHALCYSLINQSNPGTAMIDGKKGVIISVNGFIPEAVSAAAPYDLCSDNRFNTVHTWRDQRFFSARNMPNQTRGMYSEYDIEIKDVNAPKGTYRKIQPASIICFEEIDEDSINASIELSKKLGYPVPIELIDRRELARNEMIQILAAYNEFKKGDNLDSALLEQIITRFNNVRNAHRYSNLSDELLGEGEKENKQAPFNKEHLNQIIKECLKVIEQKIKSGKVEEGLQVLEQLKTIIAKEREKAYLMPTMHDKQRWTSIDMEIDYAIDSMIRTYSQPVITVQKESQSIDVVRNLQGQSLNSVVYDISYSESQVIPKQLSPDEILKISDLSMVESEIRKVHDAGFYQNKTAYGEEHIARVILYSSNIAKMEGLDERTQQLLTEAAKYSSCGRQTDSVERHEKYSSTLAAKQLKEKYSDGDIRLIQAAIELQNIGMSMGRQEDKDRIISEICTKYQIPENQRDTVLKMSNCLNDAIELDRLRFVDKAQANKEEKFSLFRLQTDSSKKLIQSSCYIQEQLAEQELEERKNQANITYDLSTKKDIMDKFFTEKIMGMPHRTQEERITESPLVRLEYFKTKYPELVDVETNSIPVKQETSSKEKEISEKQEKRRQQYEQRKKQLGLNDEPVIALDTLFHEQEILEQLGITEEMIEEASIGYRR